MINSFREKFDDWQERLIDKKILQRDIFRFVIFIALILAFGYLYRLQAIEKLDSQIYVKKIEEKSDNLMIKNKIHLQRIYDNEVLTDIAGYFTIVDFESEQSLGDYVEEKNGYLHSYEINQDKFEVFLPDDFGESTVFASFDTTLLIDAVGYDEEYVYPTKVDEKLVYNDIFPNTAVVKKFSDKGLKEYLFLKDENSPKIFNYRLNVSDDGKIVLNNRQVLILDQDDRERLILNRPRLYDRANNLLTNIQVSLLSDNILEIRITDSNELKYPLLIDFN